MSDSVWPHRRQPTRLPIPRILQARTLEWVAISFSNVWKWKVKVKSCPTLSDPMDCSPPGSSVHGFSRQEYWSGCHCLLQEEGYSHLFSLMPSSGVGPSPMPPIATSNTSWLLPRSHHEYVKIIPDLGILAEYKNWAQAPQSKVKSQNSDNDLSSFRL